MHVALNPLGCADCLGASRCGPGPAMFAPTSQIAVGEPSPAPASGFPWWLLVVGALIGAAMCDNGTERRGDR